MMKKILILNHYAGTPKYGMEYRHYEIGKELVRNGIEVCIVASSFSHLRLSPSVSEEVIDGIHFKWIKTTKYKKYGIGRLFNMLSFSLHLFFKSKFPFEPDIIIVSSPSPFPILNAIRLKKRYNAKLIYEIRDVWPKSIVELNGTSKNNPLILFLDWLDSLGIRKSDFILSPLSNIKEYIYEKGFEKEVIIIPNGISSFDKNEEEALDSNLFVVGYGGSLGDSNSIMNLIEAAVLLKENKNVFFKIVGDGNRYEDIKDIIKRKGLENIKLYGRVTKDELFSILKTCDILYKGNPRKDIYKYGVSSIKMVEYLLLKKPIIDASFGVDLVKKSESGVIVPHENPRELSKGILRMKNMEKKDLEIMANNGFEYVVNNYLYKKSIKRLLEKV
ncbi:glycosyltransferase family 4 protein [Tenacibaculum maritimum]|uniref:glycosyltransferase family 4 protein n=1 Tax=Tenacibaculum maritimum TaxID=107401 RepID=UPI00387720F0